MGTDGKNALPEGWKIRRVDRWGQVQGGRQRSPHLTQGMLRPYLRVANVLDGFIDTGDVKRMLFTDEEYENFKLANGDVLLNEGQDIDLVGRSAVYQGDPPDCCFQNTLIRFRPSQALNPWFAHFLFEYLRSKGRFSSVAVQTTSIAHLGVSRFAAINLGCPERSEQDRIVTVLSAWVKAEELCTVLIDAKTRMREALQYQLYTEQRQNSHSRNDQWPVRQIGDLVHRVRIPVKAEPAREYREIGIRSHGKGIFHKDKILGSSLGNKDVYAVQPGCLTFNIVFAWEHVVAVTTHAESGMIASHRFPMYKPKGGVLSLRYALYWLLSREGKAALEIASPGGAGRNRTLSQEAFRKLTIPLPPIEEQVRIASTLTILDREIALLRRYLEALKKQKKGLMQLLLTGKLRVRTDLGA